MKTLLTPGRTLATMLLLGVIAPAGALSLGVPRADALIGKPLELTVPARFASGDAGDQCVHADVFYGETRLPPGQVKATVVGSGEQRRVHITAQAVIDEPVVTVALRAGCGNTFSRSYTLLPELASEQVLAAAAARSVQPGGILTTALSTQAAGAGAAPARPAVQRTAMATGGEAQARVRAARPARVQAALGTARLRLDTFEQEAQQALLRVTAQIAEPLGDAARRATAGLLWQALNASPVDLVRATALVLKLEGELAQLQQSSAQTRSEVVALRRELESPAATTGSRLTQLLALLVLLAGGTAAYFWFRNRSAAQAGWTGAPLEAGDSMLREAPPPQQPAPQAGQPVQPVQPVQPPSPARFVAAAGTSGAGAPGAGAPSQPMPLVPDLSLDDLPAGYSVTPSRPERVAEVAPLEFEFPDDPQVPARVPSPTMLRVETLAATFEEVEFLASLGLWNDAMDILKTYLEDAEAPAPIAFFELMRLYVHTDDAASLVSVRKRYQQVFGVEAPRFEQITAPVGIEAFPDLAMRVTRAWGTPQVLDHIEQYLFAVPQPGRAFSLAAGRELLYLHDLAMALLTDAGPGEDAEGHALAPWASADSPAQARMAAERAAEVSGGHNFALDVDLTAQAEALPEPQQVKRPAPPAPRKPEPELRLDDGEDAFSAAVSRENRRPTTRF
jgi:hypothetical protein